MWKKGWKYKKPELQQTIKALWSINIAHNLDLHLDKIRFYYRSVMFWVQLWLYQPIAEKSKLISRLWREIKNTMLINIYMICVTCQFCWWFQWTVEWCVSMNYGMLLSPFLSWKMVQLQEVIKEAQKHLSLVITEFKQLLLWLPHLWVTSLSQEPSKGYSTAPGLWRKTANATVCYLR